jgi:DNA-binding transcriptional LysR family regulator
LSAMEMLIRVVETGSFSAASRQLKVGQPAVSKAIAQLEERLGVRLLLRSTKGLTATEAGQVFYQRAKRTVAEADEAELLARGEAAGLTGRLRVSMTISFARLHIIPKLETFLAQHPGIEIDIVMDDTNLALVEEGIDLAIRMGPLADSTFTGRKIGRSRRLVLGAPDYIDKFGRPTTPNELSEHQVFIIANRGDPPMCRFRNGSDEVSLSVGGRVRVNTGEGVRAAVLAGLGLGVGSEWLFSPEIRSGELVEVIADWQLAPMDIWAVFATGPRVGAKARALAEFVEQVLNEL